MHSDVQEVTSTPPSTSDIIQSLFWRAAIRARHSVATKLHGQVFSENDTSILEQAVDGRPYFSTLLPATYMGNLMLFNRLPMPVETLIGASTTTTTTNTSTNTAVTPTGTTTTTTSIAQVAQSVDEKHGEILSAIMDRIQEADELETIIGLAKANGEGKRKQQVTDLKARKRVQGAPPHVPEELITSDSEKEEHIDLTDAVRQLEQLKKEKTASVTARSEVMKKKVTLENTKKSLSDQIKDLTSTLGYECVQFRNNNSIPAIQATFAEGIRE